MAHWRRYLAKHLTADRLSCRGAKGLVALASQRGGMVEAGKDLLRVSRTRVGVTRRAWLAGLSSGFATAAAAADHPGEWVERLISKPRDIDAPTARPEAPLITKKLQSPDFSAMHPRYRFVAGIRPHRGGGMRLALGKPLDVDGTRRPVIHNYGHGGAGLSLAFGAADTARDLVAKSIGDNVDAPQIAIIGAGVIGLTTARALIDRYPRASIVIYARDHDPERTTSYWAGGQFAVASSLEEYRSAGERRLLANHLAASERHLQAFARTDQGRRYGIAPRTAYSLSNRGGVRLLLGDNVITASTYSSWLIDPTRLLPALHAELEQRGVRFVVRSFDSRGELAALPQDVLVNCTGGGAAALFDDQQMRPCRGHLVILQNPDKLDYFLNTWCGAGRVSHIFTRHDDIVLGGSLQWEPTGDAFDPDNGADVRTCQRILRNAQGVFEARGRNKCS